jgi:23S rRNA (adenine2503-C2)-methyltransferase
LAENPVDLRSLTLPELEEQVRAWGLPPYRARQLFAWVHGRCVTSTDPMTDISKQLRSELAERVALTPLALDAELAASDGTRKLRLKLADGGLVETVLIPDGDKLTQCLSSQVGCGLGCRFCATATMGLVRNLSVGEIVDQVYRGRSVLGRSAPARGGASPLPTARVVAEEQRVSNLVFMGMGEPLNNLDGVLAAVEILCTDVGQNFSPRRITVSTAGVVPKIAELGQRNRHVGLAVSLNATTDEVRERLMPINKRWPLAVLMEALRRYPLPRRRRITFEYVLIAGLNDTPADARRLVRLLDGIRSKVNLIPYNPVARPFAGKLQRPAPEAVDAFAQRLREKDLSTFVRQSRGDDIAAACGQLVTATRR